MPKKRGKSQSGPASAASGGPSNSGGGMAMGGYVGGKPKAGVSGGKPYAHGGAVKARAKAGAARAVETAGVKADAKVTAARAGATAGRRTAAKAAGYKEGMKNAKGYMKGGLIKKTKAATAKDVAKKAHTKAKKMRGDNSGSIREGYGKGKKSK